MNKLFKTIGIIGRAGNSGVKETLHALVTYLTSLQKNVLVEAETALLLPGQPLQTIHREKLGEKCDLVIVIGGDGSLLNATHAVANSEVPILGVNRGSLGFLADIHPTELDNIGGILEGHYTIEKRFLLNAKIELNHQTLAQNIALNEVAITPDAVPQHMLEFEIYVNEEFVCSQRADGLIIATPTGSTAYALSGGGPILHPELDAIVLVPMFPHTLSSRPIVIEGNHRIHIIISSKNKNSPRVCCDGQSYMSAPPGSHIHISKKAEHLHLVHPLDYNYYETLRSKLHWGKKLQYNE